MPETLLQRALNGPSERPATLGEEELDLIIAWVTGKITTRQMCDATDKDPTPAIYWAGVKLKKAIAEKRVEINVVKKCTLTVLRA